MKNQIGGQGNHDRIEEKKQIRGQRNQCNVIKFRYENKGIKQIRKDQVRNESRQ